MNSRARGFTLVEVLVVVLLSSLVMGSVYKMIVMQQNSTREQYAIIDTQQNARTGLAILTNELKELSAVDGDIVGASETSLTFRALNKAGVVCNKDALNNYIDVAELGEAFEIGDSILVFAEGSVTDVTDDAWLAVPVGNVWNATVALCGGVNPLGAVSWNRLWINGVLMGPVERGALVRGFTPTRYRIADNGEWGQLLRRTANSSGLLWTTTETPILDQLAATAEGGLSFRYFDAAGTLMPYNTLASNLDDIMRVQVKVAGKAVSTAKSTGENRFRDSLVSTVYLRGNFRTQ